MNDYVTLRVLEFFKWLCKVLTPYEKVVMTIRITNS